MDAPVFAVELANVPPFVRIKCKHLEMFTRFKVDFLHTIMGRLTIWDDAPHEHLINILLTWIDVRDEIAFKRLCVCNSHCVTAGHVDKRTCCTD